METNAQPKDGKLDGEYQEWCRVQYQMAHHDVWWPKGQQMNGASSTLLLLGAVIGASKLLWPEHDEAVIGLIMLSLLSALTVGLGIAYAWNLYGTMVRARGRAKNIARLVEDTHEVLKDALDDPERNVEFPLIISGIHIVALAVVLAYFWT